MSKRYDEKYPPAQNVFNPVVSTADNTIGTTPQLDARANGLQVTFSDCVHVLPEWVLETLDSVKPDELKAVCLQVTKDEFYKFWFEQHTNDAIKRQINELRQTHIGRNGLLGRLVSGMRKAGR